MKAWELFTRLGELIPPAIEAEYQRSDCCILATRLAIEVAQYFGIAAIPMSVRVVLFNKAFAPHVEAGDSNIAKWEPIDGSYSVGIGYGFNPKQRHEGRWDGHLIAATRDCFGDFSIRQAERPEKGIITGPVIVGPLYPDLKAWSALDPDSGTLVQYTRTRDARYRLAPDWRDDQRRRKLVGPIIRAIRSSTQQTSAVLSSDIQAH